MYFPSAAGSFEQETQEPEFMNQYQMTNPSSGSMDSFSSESFADYYSWVTKQQSFQAATSYSNGDLTNQSISNKTASDSFTLSDSLPSTFTLSFGNTDSPPEIYAREIYSGDLKYCSNFKSKEETSPSDFLGLTEGSKRAPSTRGNSIQQAKDHVSAERKRREKLSQRFISLSALLPDLKKMDKASVLEDATKYIKQLQTRVKELEETSAKGKDIIQESAVSIRRSKLRAAVGDDDASSDETNPSISGSSFESSPELEVRISGSDVLIRLYCQSNSSLVMKTLSEMEKSLHLSIISSSMIPFANTALIITVIAQIADEFPMTATGLWRSLQSALYFL